VVSSIDFIYHLVIALGAGALIGLEREHHKGDDVIIAGIRTFPLVSMFGFLLAYLGSNATELGFSGDASGLTLLVLAGLPIVGLMAMGLLYIRFQMGVPGLTTPFALILAYISGALVGYGLIIEAVVLSVAVTFLLVSKRRLHAFAEVLDDHELIGALEFITVAFIVYPLTLQLNFAAPWDIFNPGQPLAISNLLLIVVFVSTISFVSFLLIRWKGAARGLRFSGLLGGLVSSEATTVSLANLAKDKKHIIKTVASGIILANATMFARDLAVSAFADISLAVASIVALPLIALSLLGGFMGYMMKTEDGGKEMLEVKSPFALGPAFKFGALFLAISALVYAIEVYAGSGSDLIYLAAIGGLVSSAAVTASVASLAALGQIDPYMAAETILFATAISSLNKILLARWASKEVSQRILLGCAIMAAASFAAGIGLILFRSGL